MFLVSVSTGLAWKTAKSYPGKPTLLPAWAWRLCLSQFCAVSPVPIGRMLLFIYSVYPQQKPPASLPCSLPHHTSSTPASSLLLQTRIFPGISHQYFWLHTLVGREMRDKAMPKWQLTEEDPPAWMAVTMSEAWWQVELSLITPPWQAATLNLTFWSDSAPIRSLKALKGCSAGLNTQMIFSLSFVTFSNKHQDI